MIPIILLCGYISLHNMKISSCYAVENISQIEYNITKIESNESNNLLHKQDNISQIEYNITKIESNESNNLSHKQDNISQIEYNITEIELNESNNLSHKQDNISHMEYNITKVESNESKNLRHKQDNISQIEYNITKIVSNESINLRYKQDNVIKKEQSKLKIIVVPFVKNSFSHFEAKDVCEVAKFIVSQGNYMFKSLANSVYRYLDGKIYIYTALDNITGDYMAEVDAYFDTMINQRISGLIEEELLIIDFLETVNKIFGNKCRALLNNLKSQVNGSMLQLFSKTLLQETKNTIVNEKSKNLKYVCETLNICKSFPAFSDYLAGLLKDILKLSDDKLLTTVKFIKESVKTKVDLLKQIISKDVIYFIDDKLKSVSENISDARNLISRVTDFITNRFHLFESKERRITKSSKAVRILIDMVDKSYELLGSHYVEYQYIKMRKSIKIWKKGKEKDVQTNIKYFIDIFDDIITLYWPSEIIKEASVLVELTMLENVKINKKYKYLLTRGSSIEKVHIQNYDLYI